MAAAKILGGGNPNIICQHGIVPNKLYSRSSKLLSSTIVHPQPTKVGSFSVRAYGRADNNKLLQFERPIDAIDFSGRRITIRDVANKDNSKLNQAKKALQDLNVDTNNRLQVGMAYLMRFSFWVSFAASNVLGLIIALLVVNILRIVGSPRVRNVMDNVETVSKYLCSEELIDWVFSYVFGDGDPNQGIENKRWKMIGLYIALNGSVVTAEEIAPYLDPETTGKMNDESYMLPVLQKFDGQPKADDEGNILYHFPSVHCIPLPRTSRQKKYAGRWVYRDIKVDKFLEEHQWEFSKFDGDKLGFIAGLLHYNLFCVVSTGLVLRVKLGWGSYFSQYLFLPLLLAMYAIYAISFIVISSFRWYSIGIRNAEIVRRNEAREERAKSLESPNLFLMQKLLSARSMARRHLLEMGLVSGRPDDHPNDKLSNPKDLSLGQDQQYEQQDYERREWDSRFKELDGFDWPFYSFLRRLIV